VQEDAFLAAIVERPEEGVRLVYADWLDEHGDPARAEFIRLQVELARTDVGDPRYPSLLASSRRTGMLTRKGSKPWVDHVPGGRVMFRRGLIAGVELAAPDLLRQDPEGWRKVPVEQLHLLHDYQKPAPDPADLAARPELARIRTLWLGSFGPEVLGALLTDCPGLAGLRALRLDEGYAELGRKLKLPALDSLRLHQRFADGGWEAFVEGCRGPLRRVHLSWYSERLDEDEPEPPGWDWLRSTRHWPHLEYAALRHHLNLVYGGHCDQSASFLDPAQALKRARQLRDLTVRPYDVRGLLTCARWGPLRTLRVAGEYEPSTLEGLGDASQARQLEAFFCGNPIRDEHAEALWRGPALANLRRLSIDYLPDSQWPMVLAAPSAPRLLRLDVGARAGPRALKALAATPLPELRRLTLAGVERVGDLAPLLSSPNLPNLCTLSLPNVRAGVGPALGRLAKAKGMPHLSLVEVRPNYQRAWYVLGGGKATRVAEGMLPLDEDLWQDEPNELW
jgi:uncharacterized protein (TIGR02996 family)